MKVTKTKTVSKQITKKAAADLPKAKTTAVIPIASDDPRVGLVKLFHQQGVKQSAHYQSGDVVYAVEMYVANDPKSVQAGILACENLVENALGEKLPQMQTLLQGLAGMNQKG